MRACWTGGEGPRMLRPGPTAALIDQGSEGSDEHNPLLALPSRHWLFSVLFGLGGGYTHWVLRESHVCVADFRSGRR